MQIKHQEEDGQASFMKRNQQILYPFSIFKQNHEKEPANFVPIFNFQAKVMEKITFLSFSCKKSIKQHTKLKPVVGIL